MSLQAIRDALAAHPDAGYPAVTAEELRAALSEADEQEQTARFYGDLLDEIRIDVCEDEEDDTAVPARVAALLPDDDAIDWHAEYQRIEAVVIERQKARGHSPLCAAGFVHGNGVCECERDARVREAALAEAERLCDEQGTIDGDLLGHAIRALRGGE